MREQLGLRCLVPCAVALLLGGCSIKKMAVNALGNALAGGSGTYAKDDDPDLVGEAVPFGLKTMEALLDESPRHQGLLLAAASGFTQYGYGWVQQEADFVESRDFERARELRARARRLYRRALEYGLRGLEVASPGFRRRLRQDPEAALKPLRKEHVGLLYWTGMAWGAAISLSKDDAELTADQNLAEALERRALALDEGYERGSIHDFFVAYEGGRSEAIGGSASRAREHLARALDLSQGLRVAAYVTFAETVPVAAQDRKQFQELLEEALAIELDRAPEMRLSNTIYQRRARWLLARVDELFIE